MTTDGDIETAMSALLTPAPATLAPNVLAEVGLADLYARFDSPIGPLVVAWNGLGVSAVEAAADDATFEANHVARTGRPTHRAERLPDGLGRAIARRLDGDRRVRIDLDLRGHTDFERDVWHKALEIPRGEVRPYGWVAAEIGRPEGGPRRRHRPGAQPSPAHRALPSRRPDRRQHRPVLAGRATEQADDPGRRGAGSGRDGSPPRAQGMRYVGSDTTHIVCLPTCHAAKRITPAHRVPFRSLRERGRRRVSRVPRVPSRIGCAARPDSDWTP